MSRYIEEDHTRKVRIRDERIIYTRDNNGNVQKWLS